MLHIFVPIFGSWGSVISLTFIFISVLFLVAFYQYEEFPALCKCSIFQLLLLSFTSLFRPAKPTD